MLMNGRIGTMIVGLCVVALVLTACGSDTSNAKTQHFTVVIYDGVPGVFTEVITGIKAELAASGYAEGEEITYVHVTNASELINALTQDVDLVVSIPGSMALMAGVSLGDIPLVFVPSNDPVGQGLVKDLRQPGGNVTGIIQQDATSKRLDLLLKMIPDAHKIYAVYDSTNAVSVQEIEELEALSAALDIEIVRADSPLTVPQITRKSIDNIPDDVDAIFMVQGHAAGLGAGWPEAAIRHKIPLSAIGLQTVGANYGPLMAYGPDMHTMGQHTARLISTILNGTPAGALPVEYADLYVMLDLRVAELIGFEVPDTTLVQAFTVMRAETDGALPALAIATPPPLASLAGDGGSGACTAYETNPAGTNQVCATVTCDSLLDSFVTYTARTDVSACPTTDLVGTCLVNDMEMHYYEGDITLLKMGCGFSGGEWRDPA